MLHFCGKKKMLKVVAKQRVYELSVAEINNDLRLHRNAHNLVINSHNRKKFLQFEEVVINVNIMLKIKNRSFEKKN